MFLSFVGLNKKRFNEYISKFHQPFYSLQRRQLAYILVCVYINFWENVGILGCIVALLISLLCIEYLKQMLNAIVRCKFSSENDIFAPKLDHPSAILFLSSLRVDMQWSTKSVTIATG